MDDDRLMTPGGRLKWARERAKYPDAVDFAKAAGVKPVTYRAYEANQNGFAKHVIAFSKLLGVPVEWLLDGGPIPEGEPPRPGEVNTPPDLEKYDIELIRRVDISYAMGDGAVIADYPETGFIPFDRQFLRTLTGAATASLIVANGDGDSMQPTIYDSDYVLIDTSVKRVTMQDKIYALTVAGAGMIKRLRVLPEAKVLVLSDNPLIPPQEFDADDVYIVGRVRWIGRKM